MKKLLLLVTAIVALGAGLAASTASVASATSFPKGTYTVPYNPYYSD